MSDGDQDATARALQSAASALAVMFIKERLRAGATIEIPSLGITLTRADMEGEMKANELGISPAPWVYDDNRAGHEGLCTVFDADGKVLMCFGDMEDCDWLAIADGYLVSAAPDLYECLHQIATGDIDSLTAWQERARAALKKAKEG